MFRSERFLPFLYTAIRRLHVVDLKRLLLLQKAQVRDVPIPPGYRIVAPTKPELGQWIQSRKAPQSIGESDQLSHRRRVVTVLSPDEKVVSYSWLAFESVDAADNYSRSSHLGTAIAMPPRNAFLFRAWTDPEHRGKRLLGAQIGYVMSQPAFVVETLWTTVDWTNTASFQGLTFAGMQPSGHLLRMGRGRYQFSLVPRAAETLGVELAFKTPGCKFAY